MKLKRLAISMMSAGLLMSLGTGSMTVSAEEGNQGESLAESSEVKVQFEAPKTVSVDIYDPNDLNKTIDEESAKEAGNVTGQTGPLSLNYVTNLDFGVQSIDVKKSEYKFIAPQDHYIQVTDSRGSGEGWHVTAKLGEFEDSDAEETDEKVTTLRSATIDFLNGSASTPNEVLEEYQPEVNQEFILEAGNDAQKVVNAKEGKGQGTWLTHWLQDAGNSSEIKLTVPAESASAGNHKTTITWTLENGPYSSNHVATDD